jgi:NAD/NADP transhydrogenase beta subunit
VKEVFINLLYIAAAVMFIFGIKWLGNAATARRGNRISSLGMLLAVVATLLYGGLEWPLVAAGILLGSAIGVFAALRVKMTGMPEMVALFNGFGGLASLLVGAAEYYKLSHLGGPAYLKELAEVLERNGTEVRFAIHPVAGRMPGHMNVLLAEADVPYEQLQEMEPVNAIMESVDVAIVIGANDVVNPAALDDPASPIYGMPIIRAHEAHTIYCLKRGKGTGFSGLENRLFYHPNTRMLYGDAKVTVSALVAEFPK